MNWIKVTDRLPEKEGDYYLVWYYERTFDYESFTDAYFNGFNFCIKTTDPDDFYSITHWCEITPPKEEK